VKFFLLTLEALPLANGLDLLATSNMDAEDEDEQETPVYDKFDPLLHRSTGRSKGFVFYALL